MSFTAMPRTLEEARNEILMWRERYYRQPVLKPVHVQEPVAMEAVYETIIRWDEGGGKRSRRELARRIVDLYTTTTPAAPVKGTQA